MPFQMLVTVAVFALALLPLSAPGQERTEVPAPVALPDSSPAPFVPPPVWSPDPTPIVPAVPAPLAEAGPFGNGMGRDFRPSVYRADYRVTWFPNELVQGQNTHLGFVREDLNATVPLWHDDCNDFAATFHIRNEVFSTDAVLLNPPRPFPEQLWDVRFGGSYRHLFDNGWIAGASVSLGSSGDRPFENARDFTGSVNAFLTVPQGERNYWLFNLAYSSNSELPYPIPGIAFVWQPADNFRLHIGLPFQLMYRPIDDLQFDVSYMLLYTFRARTTYRIAPWLRVYASYDVGNEAYPLADRLNDNDRLFYYDQRVTTGLLFKLGQQMSLDLSGGYAFDRYYFEGQHLSDSNGNRLTVGDGPFLSLQFQTHW